MSGDHGSEIEFRTERISSRELWSQAWRILWPEYFWITLGICLVGFVVGSAAPMGVLMGPMMCGMFMCFFAMMSNQRPTFDMLFRGFDMFIDSLVAALIMLGVSFVIMIPIGFLIFFGMLAAFAAAQQEDGAAVSLIVVLLGIGYVVAIVFMVVVQALFVFSYPLIVDYKLSGVDAVKLSARAAWANLGNVIRLVCLDVLATLAAALMCYLPLLLVIPVSMFAKALLYRRVFPGPAFATAEGPREPSPDPDDGGYRLDGGISETGPGAGTQIDEWE